MSQSRALLPDSLFASCKGLTDAKMRSRRSRSREHFSAFHLKREAVICTAPMQSEMTNESATASPTNKRGPLPRSKRYITRSSAHTAKNIQLRRSKCTRGPYAHLQSHDKPNVYTTHSHHAVKFKDFPNSLSFSPNQSLTTCNIASVRKQGKVVELSDVRIYPLMARLIASTTSVERATAGSGAREGGRETLWRQGPGPLPSQSELLSRRLVPWPSPSCSAS